MKGAEVETVFAAIRRTGLVPRGAFSLAEGERVGELADIRTIVLAGMVGRDGWERIRRVARGERWACRSARPLEPAADRELWRANSARRRCFRLAGRLSCRSSDGRSAQNRSIPHRIGLLIHPYYGLWHSYRGALGLSEELAVAEPAPVPSPCETCSGRWCLKTCPVGAFSEAGYDVAACAGHLRSAAGGDCMAFGCRARRACPVGAEHAYGPEQASFLMRAFLRGQDVGHARSTNQPDCGHFRSLDLAVGALGSKLNRALAPVAARRRRNGRPQCANSGRSLAARRTDHVDPKHAFKIGFWTGEKGEKPVVGATGARVRFNRSGSSHAISDCR